MMFSTSTINNITHSNLYKNPTLFIYNNQQRIKTIHSVGVFVLLTAICYTLYFSANGVFSQFMVHFSIVAIAFLLIIMFVINIGISMKIIKIILTIIALYILFMCYIYGLFNQKLYPKNNINSSVILSFVNILLFLTNLLLMWNAGKNALIKYEYKNFFIGCGISIVFWAILSFFKIIEEYSEVFMNEIKNTSFLSIVDTLYGAIQFFWNKLMNNIYIFLLFVVMLALSLVSYMILMSHMSSLLKKSYRKRPKFSMFLEINIFIILPVIFILFWYNALFIKNIDVEYDKNRGWIIRSMLYIQNATINRIIAFKDSIKYLLEKHIILSIIFISMFMANIYLSYYLINIYRFLGQNYHKFKPILNFTYNIDNSPVKIPNNRLLKNTKTILLY